MHVTAQHFGIWWASKKEKGECSTGSGFCTPSPALSTPFPRNSHAGNDQIDAGEGPNVVIGQNGMETLVSVCF